jgi:hypothetical protein
VSRGSQRSPPPLRLSAGESRFADRSNTLLQQNHPLTARANHPAWNKGKLTGPKPPLRPGHVWLIRAKLQLERRTRDLALLIRAAAAGEQATSIPALAFRSMSDIDESVSSNEALIHRGLPVGRPTGSKVLAR